MNVDLTSTWREAEYVELSGRVAVVIDVLRATSTMVAAFDAGAASITPVASVEEARETARALGADALLCGERGGIRLEGFDLGNSPREYTSEAVGGRPLVLTTTNGTSAVEVGRNAEALFACSLLNVAAVARRLAEFGRDVTIICSGTEGRLSKDDLYCGGLLVSALFSPGAVGQLSDGGRVAVEWYLSRQGRSEYVLSSSQHGQRLIELGFGEDLAFCARENVSRAIPIWNGTQFVVE